MLFRKQPSSRGYTLPGVRSLMDWYYMRLLITVAPEQVLEWPPGSVAGPAQALPAGVTGPSRGLAARRRQD